MPDPAVKFNVSTAASARAVTNTAVCSSPSVLHKDWTKGILRPYSIQSIIDGDATNNQYQVNLRVPQSATHVGLFWMTQAVLSDTGASINSLSAKLGTGSMTGYAMRLFGRFPSAPSANLFGPYEAGLSNAVEINETYGYWRPLANIQLTINSTLAFADNISTTSAGALNYRVSTTRRLIINPIVNGGLVASMSLSSNNQPLQGASITITASAWDSVSGLIPLKGCTNILLMPELFGSSETTTITGAATAGSISSVDFTAIGASFHS
jgi:hypothetical protein